MIVRVAVEAEAARLGEIGFEAWRTSAFGANDAGRTDADALRGEFTQFCIEKPESIILAADGDRFLGWGAREFSDQVITDLWVAPEAQGKGVGAALLAALEEAIAIAGFSHAELETYAGNAGAVRFYSRQGYEPVWRGMKFTASLNYDLEKIRFRKMLPAAE
ncbi:MAG TPA: GNAT family N-acetyltransferase [Devosia sp.]|nr:GNAT family N-acetyltransferase [Devosia sp.]